MMNMKETNIGKAEKSQDKKNAEISANKFLQWM